MLPFYMMITLIGLKGSPVSSLTNAVDIMTVSLTRGLVVKILIHDGVVIVNDYRSMMIGQFNFSTMISSNSACTAVRSQD
jgi:hypothetical protein